MHSADEGTLFLNEIGDMGLSLQAKILQLIENKSFRPLGAVSDIEVNVGIIAATNKDLTKAIKIGEFRNDLYYRLNAFTLKLSPLRERMEDIILLTEHFLKQYSYELKKKNPPVLSKEVKNVFCGITGWEYKRIKKYYRTCNYNRSGREY